MENVRLTIQIRDQRNTTRVTMHRDVELKHVESKASELSTRAKRMFVKEKKAGEDEG